MSRLMCFPASTSRTIKKCAAPIETAHRKIHSSDCCHTHHSPKPRMVKDRAGTFAYRQKYPLGTGNIQMYVTPLLYHNRRRNASVFCQKPPPRQNGRCSGQKTTAAVGFPTAAAAFLPSSSKNHKNSFQSENGNTLYRKKK